MMVTIHGNDVLVSGEEKVTREQFVSNLCSWFKITELREAEYYMGHHTSRQSRPVVHKQSFGSTNSSSANHRGLLSVNKTSITPIAAGVAPVSKESGPKTP